MADGAPELEPEMERGLHAAGGGEVAEVHHVLPAELGLEEFARRRRGRRESLPQTNMV